MKPGDEVVGLDGRVYVVEVSTSVMFGLEAVACVDCDLHPSKTKLPACNWDGKKSTCLNLIGTTLCFKLKE